MTTIGATPDIEIESPLPTDYSVEVEIPPFAAETPVDAILVSGPEGREGPQGSQGIPGEAAELSVDPVLAFENALA